MIYKQKPSGFFGTNMTSYLTLLGCDSVIVTGTTTSGCVRATVLDAFSLNYRISLAEEGCFDRSQASHAINLCDMNAKYADVVKTSEVLEFFDSRAARPVRSAEGRPGREASVQALSRDFRKKQAASVTHRRGFSFGPGTGASWCNGRERSAQQLGIEQEERQRAKMIAMQMAENNAVDGVQVDVSRLERDQRRCPQSSRYCSLARLNHEASVEAAARTERVATADDGQPHVRPSRSAAPKPRRASV